MSWRAVSGVCSPHPALWVQSGQPTWVYYKFFSDFWPKSRHRRRGFAPSSFYGHFRASDHRVRQLHKLLGNLSGFLIYAVRSKLAELGQFFENTIFRVSGPKNLRPVGPQKLPYALGMLIGVHTICPQGVCKISA